MTGTYPTPATIPCIDSPTRTLDHAGVRCPDLCAGRPLPPAGRERAGGEFDQPNPCRLRHRSKQEFRHAAGSDRTAYSCLSSWGDARPGERLVVPRPVVPSAQFVERRGVTATWSMRLLQPWQRHSEAGAAARTKAVVARQDAHAWLYVKRTVMLRACSMPSDLPVQADCAFNIITGFEEGGERVGRSVGACSLPLGASTTKTAATARTPPNRAPTAPTRRRQPHPVAHPCLLSDPGTPIREASTGRPRLC